MAMPDWTKGLLRPALAILALALVGNPIGTATAGLIANSVGAIINVGIGHAMTGVEAGCQTGEEKKRDLASDMVAGVAGSLMKDATSDALGGGTVGTLLGAATGAATKNSLKNALDHVTTSHERRAELARSLCEIVLARRRIAAASIDEIIDLIARNCHLADDAIRSSDATFRRGVACLMRTDRGRAAFDQMGQNIYTTNVAACGAAQATLRRLERVSQDNIQPGESHMPAIDVGCDAPENFEQAWSTYFNDRLAPQ
jgi:hypothetical protein